MGTRSSAASLQVCVDLGMRLASVGDLLIRNGIFTNLAWFMQRAIFLHRDGECEN